MMMMVHVSIDSGGYVRQDTSDGSFINNYIAILFYGSYTHTCKKAPLLHVTL